MPQPLKDFIESVNKRFEEKFAPVKETDQHYYNPWLPDVKTLLKSEVTQAYELGQATALAMVMREIDEMVLPKEAGDSTFEEEQKRRTYEVTGYNQALSTLKQKLSGNGE